MLTTLKEVGLIANNDKRAFGKRYCEFLGHVVGQSKVIPSQCKVDTLVSLVEPRTKKGVRQFLGVSGYYRKFILEFAARTIHLTEATKKDAPNRVLWLEEIPKEIEDINFLCLLPSLTLINLHCRQMPPLLVKGQCSMFKEKGTSHLWHFILGSSTPGNDSTERPSRRVWQ